MNQPEQALQTRCGALSDTGRKRSHNEDCYLADTTLGLFVVVDGMGGHAFGDVAARVITEKIGQIITQTADKEATWPFPFDPSLSSGANRLKNAVVLANDEVGRRIAEEHRLQGMGATMSAALVDGERIVLVNVGDCRTYLIRDATISQVSVDHSWVAEQVRSGVIAPDKARQHPWRNRVTRAVVGRERLEVELSEIRAQRGDQLVLCSDGLHGLVTDEEILAHVTADGSDPQATCQALVDTANERGAPDNVTVVLVVVEGSGSSETIVASARADN